MRILVVGGRGVLGRTACDALRNNPDLEVATGGRRGAEICVDLSDPETFQALAPWDMVVNAADSLAAPPDAALAWVYDQGGTWVETSSEPETLQRALRLRNVERSGRVILGAGVFTGLSNLVAARAAGRVQECVRLDLGIRFSPLSRAGAGMVALMVSLAGTPASWWENGERCHGPPLSPGPLLPFQTRTGRPRRRLGWRAPFAEVELLAASLGVPSLGVHAVPAPSWLGPLFAFTPPGLFRWGPTRVLAEAGLRVLRTRVLRRISSPVTLVAVAHGSERAVCRLRVEDGLAAGGQMIAALCQRLVEHAPPPGVHCVDEVTDLGTILAAMAAQAVGPSGASLQTDCVDDHSPV